MTAGQAFGGDLEAVSVHSGLLAARLVVGADVAVVAQGPGNLGTGTRWGFSGVSAGEAVNAAGVLRGRPVAALRVSAADARERHRGVSHHSLTALGRVALVPADVVVPLLPGPFGDRVREQAAGLAGRHRLVEEPLDGLDEALAASPVPLSTMGRGVLEDAPGVPRRGRGRAARRPAGAVVTGVEERTAPASAAAERAGLRRRVAAAGPAAGLALAAAVVAAMALRRNDWLLTSDSVAQQSVVRTWFAVGHARTYLPPDTWLLKLPLYGVVEGLPLAPPTRVWVEAVVLALVMVGLAVWACRLLARQLTPPGEPPAARPAELVLPFAWFATLSGGIGSYLVALPNSRNVELGLALLVIALAGTPFPLPRWPVLVAAGAGTAALLAVLWVDDPYVAYLVGGPLALTAAGWWLRPAARGGRDRRLLVVAVVLLASLALIRPVRSLLASAGVIMVPDATAPTFDPGQILGHVPILGPAAQAQLGLLEPGTPTATVAHVLGVAVVVLGAAAAVLLVVRGWRGGAMAVFVLGVHPLVVVAGVLVNRTIYDFHAGRYLVLGFFDLAACLALAPAALRTATSARTPPPWVPPGRAWRRCRPW